MSVEDLDPNFQSDESDYDEETGKKRGTDVGNEDKNDVHYMDLVNLHNELMHFEHIYMNNIEMDMQVDSFTLTIFSINSSMISY